jgi:hypothetical protein
VLVIEVSNRGDVKSIERDVAAVKDMFKALEVQFPG